MANKLKALLIGLALVAAACSYQNDAVAFCSADGRVHDILTIGNDVFIAGEFTQLISPDGTPFTRRGIGSCDLTTGDVTSFNVGLTIGSIVNDVAVSDDGLTVFFGGDFTKNTPFRRNAAAAFAATGALRGWAPAPSLNKVNVLLPIDTGANQVVYTGGLDDARLYQGTDQVGAGSQITTFTTSVDGSVNAMALSGDGTTLYVGGGDIDAINGQLRNGAGAVDASTGSVLAFAPDLEDPSDDSVRVFDIVEHGGHIYYCGDWWQTEGIGIADNTGIPGAEQDQRNINRFDPVTGLADRTWWPVTNGGVQGCAINAEDNVILIGGHFQWINGERRDDLATLSLDGGAVFEAPALELWDPETASGPGSFAVHISSDDSAIVGGADQLGAQDNGIPANFIARFPAVEGG